MFPKAECTYVEKKFSHPQTLPLSPSPEVKASVVYLVSKSQDFRQKRNRPNSSPGGVWCEE